MAGRVTTQGATRPNQQLAIMLVALACAFFGGTTVLAKFLGQPVAGPPLSPFQVSFARFGFALLGLLVVLVVVPPVRPTFRGANLPLHLARAACGWTGVTALFAAAAKMPVAEATALSFLSPIVTMILAVPLLGERLGPRKLAAAAIAVIGGALVLQPGTDAFQPAGLLALFAALAMGLEAIFIKRLSDSEPAMRVLVINNAIGALLAAMVAVFVWVAPTLWQWVGLVAVGLIMVSGQAIFIQALKRGEASAVLPAIYTILLFTALYDFAFFGEQPGWIAIIGAGLIVSAAVTLAVRSDQ